MARATTRRARNGWLSARLFATLAMVFATLATPGAAGGEDSFTPVPAPQPHACSCPPPNASEERPGSLSAARAERPDAGAFRTTIATFEGSRSFGEIARASYPSFASSRREGVVLRLGQPWGNLPQASDSLYAIAALFRVSSGVGLCARVSLRGPSRR